MNLERLINISNPDSHFSAEEMYDALREIHSHVTNPNNNRIVKQFIKAYEVSKRKNWDRIYIGVDIHETVLEPTWSKTLSATYYPYAKEALQLMSACKEVCLILWSCSLPEFNQEYLDNFKKDDILFDYINSNNEVKSTDYADFETKLYFSVGLDDKFGFDPNEDWEMLYKYFSHMTTDFI